MTERELTPQDYERVTYELVHADDALVRLGRFLQADAVWQAYLDVIVRRARRQGYSWQDIGDVMGITRQAVHARFADKMDEDMPESMDKWFGLLKARYVPRDPDTKEDGSS